MADILVIDDEAGMRSVVRRMLESAGHVVREASNGSQGLRQYGERAADLVLCDLFMPGKGGLQTLSELRTNDPDARVICISGGTSLAPDPVVSVEALGGKGVLYKPFSTAELLQAVEFVLGW